jgi:hypothetical protein
MTLANTFEGITPLNRAWIDLLRANCLTLVERPAAVTGVSVSRGFAHGAEVERDAVITLAQRMAEEYGLLTEISLHGHFLTIRFTRAKAGQRPVGAQRSLLERVRALFRARRKLVRQERQPNEEGEKALTEVRP